MLLPSALLYRYDFRVETHDIEFLPEGRLLLIGNHSGQFGYDGAMPRWRCCSRRVPPRQPGFANLKGVGKRLGLPSFPITISSPWLGLLGPSFALPVKYHIYFGEPLRFEGGPTTRTR
jgi:1-acyl-sn-glycerol-3-phosphate acyltransferase